MRTPVALRFPSTDIQRVCMKDGISTVHSKMVALVVGKTTICRNYEIVVAKRAKHLQNSWTGYTAASSITLG